MDSILNLNAKLADGFKQQRLPMHLGTEDISIAYRDWGDSSDPNKLFCMHGVTRNCRDFDYLAASMCNDYNVICIDTIGRGQSGYYNDVANYNMQNAMMAASNVIAATSPTNINLLGTSMGGLISMSIASQKDSPVRKLILNDVGPFVPMGLNRAISEHEKSKPMYFATKEEAIKFHKTHALSFGPMNEAQLEMFTMNGLRRLEDGGYGYDYDEKIQSRIASYADGDFDVWHIWDRIKCPVLVLRGVTSKALLPEVAQEMTQRGPKAELVEIAETGHAPHLMNDEQVGIIRDWLADG